MKLLLLIWCLALGTCIGVYAYIYVSIGQMIEETAPTISGTHQTVNPQQTINGKELQGD